jgi:hypothetical protein
VVKEERKGVGWVGVNTVIVVVSSVQTAKQLKACQALAVFSLCVSHNKIFLKKVKKRKTQASLTLSDCKRRRKGL